MAENVSNLSLKEFDNFISKGNAIVDFWAEWCGPCKIIGPYFEEASKKFAGKASFGKVNVDKEYEIAERFAVMSIPTLIFFKDGEIIDQTVGAYPQDELESKIREVFGI